MIADFPKRLGRKIGRGFIHTIEVCQLGVFGGIELGDNFAGQLAPADTVAGVADSVVNVAVVLHNADGGVKVKGHSQGAAPFMRDSDVFKLRPDFIKIPFQMPEGRLIISAADLIAVEIG